MIPSKDKLKWFLDYSVLNELYIGCAFFGHEPREWSLSVDRSAQGAYKDKKCLEFPASVCSWVILQTELT